MLLPFCYLLPQPLQLITASAPNSAPLTINAGRRLRSLCCTFFRWAEPTIMEPLMQKGVKFHRWRIKPYGGEKSRNFLSFVHYCRKWDWKINGVLHHSFFDLPPSFLISSDRLRLAVHVISPCFVQELCWNVVFLPPCFISLAVLRTLHDPTAGFHLTYFLTRLVSSQQTGPRACRRELVWRIIHAMATFWCPSLGLDSFEIRMVLKILIGSHHPVILAYARWPNGGTAS